MKALHNKLIAVLLVLALCLACFHTDKVEANTKKNEKYLVLVQIKNGTWKEYSNMIEVSESGNLMIQAKRISKALGFTYDNHVGMFNIFKSDSEFNTYTKDNEKYTYTSQAGTEIITTADKVYNSKTSKYNLCPLFSLKTLVNYKCFSNLGNTEYAGYDGVVCISKYHEIPESIPTAVKKATPTPTPQPEPESITIEGVEFPVRKGFLTKFLSDWGGTAPLWSELELKVDKSIIPSTDLWYDKTTIGFSHQGVNCEGVKMTKTDNGYDLSISVKLSGSVTANQSASIVKAMIASISSKPTAVYNAIFESFTTQNNHGINEKSYVTIGDCKLKVYIKDGVVTYYIREVK